MSNSFVTPWRIACQAPLSVRFSRQEYWSGLPFPSPEDLPDPGIEPTSSALWEDSLPLSHQGSPCLFHEDKNICFIDFTGMLCGWLKPRIGRDFQISVKSPLFFPSWRLYHHFFSPVFFEQMVWRTRVFPSFILILELETKPSCFYSFQMLGLNGFSPGRI